MGIFSEMQMIHRMNKIKKGGKEPISIADITNLIINLPEAHKYLDQEQYQAVYALFQELRKIRTKMMLDIKGYYEEAAVIISVFNQIAPYEKYSGMDKTEAIFFMNGIKPILEELRPQSEILLNKIMAVNPEINKFFLDGQESPEKILKKVSDAHKTKESEHYINYLSINANVGRDRVKAFYGVLIMHDLQGKERALAWLDKLFKEWISKETEQNRVVILQDIGFFCSVLVPKKILGDKESDSLRKHYVNLMVQHMLKQG